MSPRKAGRIPQILLSALLFLVVSNSPVVQATIGDEFNFGDVDNSEDPTPSDTATPDPSGPVQLAPSNNSMAPQSLTPPSDPVTDSVTVTSLKPGSPGVGKPQKVNTGDPSPFFKPANKLEADAQKQLIWQPFIKDFAECAPGCTPWDYASKRYEVPSCHRFGRAIDVHGMTCNGVTYQAINGGRFSGRFAQLVQCMEKIAETWGIRPTSNSAPSANISHVLWYYPEGESDPTAGHRDHAHFSMGCIEPGHSYYY